MPSTPARDLLRTSRESLRQRARLEQTISSMRSTKKQKRYAQHMLDIWRERCADALRAYVNDLLVDDDMHRVDLLKVPNLGADYVHVAHNVSKSDGDWRRAKHLATAFVQANPTSVTKSAPNWFASKTQALIGLALLPGQPYFRVANTCSYDVHEPSVYAKYAPNAPRPTLKAMATPAAGPPAEKGLYPFAHGESPIGHSTATTSFSTNVSKPNVVTSGAEQDVARCVVDGARMHGHTPEHYRDFNTLVELVCIGGKGAALRIPRHPIAQESDCEAFLLAMFARDSVLFTLPLALKREIFVWTVLFYRGHAAIQERLAEERARLSKRSMARFEAICNDEITCAEVT